MAFIQWALWITYFYWIPKHQWQTCSVCLLLPLINALVTLEFESFQDPEEVIDRFIARAALKYPRMRQSLQYFFDSYYWKDGFKSESDYLRVVRSELIQIVTHVKTESDLVQFMTTEMQKREASHLP
jgi:hypothetical protein